MAKGKNHRYGLCFTWDIANIDNYDDYVMLPALAGPDGLVNITRQNNSETSGFCVKKRPVCTDHQLQRYSTGSSLDRPDVCALSSLCRTTGGTYGEEGKPNIFEMSTNSEGGEMLKHEDLGDNSPVEVRESQSVNGPLAVLNDYYDGVCDSAGRCKMAS